MLPKGGQKAGAPCLARSVIQTASFRPRFHFTPTRASWLNQIEIWFSILQGQSLSGASFTSLEQLQEHIDAFIHAYNDKAEPFAWTKKKAGY